MAYTARQCLEGVNIELSKVNAPTLLLSEFNYYINKAIKQVTNKKYNFYDTNQQSTDDLRVLASTTTLKPSSQSYGIEDLYPSEGTSIFELPQDYLHILNCICIFQLQQPYKCKPANSYYRAKATKLTADIWGGIMNDYYQRPLPTRPYYYIHNINTTTTSPTNLYQEGNFGTDYIDENVQSTHPRTLTLNFQDNTVEVGSGKAGVRYGNPSKILCEIKYGEDKIYKLVGIKIDYLKVPQTIELTQVQLDKVVDTSQILEFPDYICQEIINELVILVMARDADPRVQIQSQVTQSIATPAQQQNLN